MSIVDTALKRREQEGMPVRVGLVGAGYMGRAIALELLTPVTGMRLAVVANRTLANARRAYHDAGVEKVRTVSTVGQLEHAIADGQPAITDDATLLWQAGGIDAVIECTGDVEFGASVALGASQHGKHVILVNAELDATLGPLLKVYAERQGVVITGTDGDEPGVAMNLFRLAQTIGYRPVAAGNFKGMIDPYRTPQTQRAFAEQHGQKPHLITSFADGTKLAMEATILANATGFRVSRRGMHGHHCAHVRDALTLYPLEELLSGGIVDYLVGAEPHTGAFLLVYEDDPRKQQSLRYFKMGDGPLYAFYTPYHLPHLQVVPTVARAVLFGDPTVAPRSEPLCDVLTVAKRDLKAGDILDGIGGFDCYGVIDNADIVRHQNLLPMGLSQDCRLKRDVPKDGPIGYDDVDLPSGRLSDRLRAEQDAYFAAAVHV
jgi:predicted homoserine dehydrogenase-like protein